MTIINLPCYYSVEELLDGCEHQRAGVNRERSLSVKCVSGQQIQSSVCVCVCVCGERAGVVKVSGVCVCVGVLCVCERESVCKK